MTGYTSALVEKDMDFPQFAMFCARAMGVCITMRDDPLDAPIPDEFQPEPYHKESLEKALDEYEKLNAMTQAEKIECGTRMRDAAVLETQERKKKHLGEKEGNITKLRDTLAEVESWQPPTPDHTQFKTFMAQQLTDSIKHESGYGEYYDKDIEKTQNMTPLQFWQAELDQANEDIKYHGQKWEEEVKRTKERNLWIKNLRDSLAAHKKARQ